MYPVRVYCSPRGLRFGWNLHRSVVYPDQFRNDRDRRSVALPKTNARGKIPDRNSEIVTVTEESAFEIPTSPNWVRTSPGD